MEDQTMAALPGSGAALLCAASSADVALAPKSGDYTMFSGALLKALWEGSPRRGQLLSFDDLRELANQFVRQQFRDGGVQPEIHIPDQRQGDISKFGVFPNAAWTPASDTNLWKANILREENEFWIQLSRLNECHRLKFGSGTLDMVTLDSKPLKTIWWPGWHSITFQVGSHANQFKLTFYRRWTSVSQIQLWVDNELILDSA